MAEPRQSLALNVLLSAAVTLATLATAEIWARRMEPAPPAGAPVRKIEWKADFYTIKPASADWPAAREFNRDGVRDRAHAPEKPDGVRRVICLGDSVTLGPDGHPEQAYPQQLQEKLDARGPGFEVFNVSLWGWATTQERTAYERIARSYHPDDVVLGVCLNDIQDLQNELARPPRWLAALHRRSALVRRIVNARGREIRGVEELFTEADSPRVRAGLARLEDEIRKLEHAVEADHARLAVMLFPYRGQMVASAPPPIVEERLREFCKREGLPFIDPLPDLRPLGEAAFLEGDGIHLSAAGGERVADAVIASGILPLPTPASAGAGVGALVAALRDPDPEKRREAVWALGRRGAAAAASALRQALHDPQERVRAEAADALGRLGDQGARPDLTGALHDPRQAVRWRAASALARLGPGVDATTIRALSTLLESADPHVAQFAAWALGEAGPAARAAVPALLTSLRARDLGVRAVGAQTLGRIDGGDPAALTALAEASRDDTWPEHWHATRALGHLGPPAVPQLVGALGSPDEAVRLEAAQALGRIGPQPNMDEEKRALKLAANDSDPDVRSAAAKALHRLSRR